MNYFIYSFTYLNYPKAYENLLAPTPSRKELGETSARTLLQPRFHVPACGRTGTTVETLQQGWTAYQEGCAPGPGEGYDHRRHGLHQHDDARRRGGRFANTKKEWDLYRKAHTKRNTEHYKYNITLYEGTKLKIAGQLQKAAEAYGRLIDIVPDTERNCRAAHWHLWRPRRCNGSCTTSTKGLALVAEAEKLYVKYKIGDGMQSVYQTYAIFYEDMGHQGRLRSQHVPILPDQRLAEGIFAAIQRV